MDQKSSIPVSDEIWGMIRETQKNIKELQASQKETDRQIQKELQVSHKEFYARQKEIQAGQKETGQQLQKLSYELSASQKETDRQIQKIGGRFNQRWGALVESLVEGKLVQLFQDRGIDITQTHTRSQAEWRKPGGPIERREFDIIVANGTEVVVVEVKTTLTPKEVRYFLETLGDFKNYFTRYKTETIYGAVAYLSSENKAHLLAEEKGLFLIRATGDSASLANKKDFQPKAFN